MSERLAAIASGLAELDLPDDDEVGLQAYFHARDMTDGLPIVVPTIDRLTAFLHAAGRDPAEVVGVGG